MIVLNKSSWLRMVFAVRGSSISTTWPRIVAVTAFASVVTWADAILDPDYKLTTTPLTLIGVAMSIFLGFRNNESYDRFWEGRTLWGGLVNVSRSFARQSLTLIAGRTDADKDDVRRMQRYLVRGTVAYVHAVRHHLRGTDPLPELEAYLGADDMAYIREHDNRPVAILQRMGQTVRVAWDTGYVHDFHVPVLEGSLTEMTALQGGCERIKGTPLPFAYNVLIHRIVVMYTLAMPFGLVETAGLLTPVVVCLISYAFFGLDAIGDAIEQPFEEHENDLPLNAICRTIEINLLQLLEEEEVPDHVQPVNGVLM